MAWLGLWNKCIHESFCTMVLFSFRDYVNEQYQSYSWAFLYGLTAQHNWVSSLYSVLSWFLVDFWLLCPKIFKPTQFWFVVWKAHKEDVKVQILTSNWKLGFFWACSVVLRCFIWMLVQFECMSRKSGKIYTRIPVSLGMWLLSPFKFLKCLLLPKMWPSLYLEHPGLGERKEKLNSMRFFWEHCGILLAPVFT